MSGDLFQAHQSADMAYFVVLPSTYYKGWGTGGPIMPQRVWDFLFWCAHALGRLCADSGNFLYRRCMPDDE
eukprot:11921732-Ditylum_brightwellii.AAC.1